MATMEVILATKIEGLGAEADLVTVKAGYGRNYLIPQGLAHEATASNRRFIANLQAARAKREAEELSAAQEVAAKINGLTVDLTLEVGQGGKAFGAITNQNIHDALTAQGVEVDRRAIELEKPIKSEGEHEVAIKVHPQVEATLKVVVKENAYAARIPFFFPAGPVPTLGTGPLFVTLFTSLPCTNKASCPRWVSLDIMHGIVPSPHRNQRHDSTLSSNPGRH